MKETILYYHVPTEVKNFLDLLEKELKIEIKEIEEHQINQKMGYLLGIVGFKENKVLRQKDLDQPLLYFAFMSDKQLDIILSMLRQAHLPPIPYKAMMTETNLQYTFDELYQEIKKEHAIMSKK